MSGLVAFAARFGTEERRIFHLAGLRWPGGYVCARCGGRGAWRLKKRPRVYECRGCGHQESVTAGTIFHRTRTGLPQWFLAAYLMGKDKRGVSAKFLQRELGVAYQTAWTIAHKLRHGLGEDPARPIGGYLEADETFVGGRGDRTSPGRSLENPNKSLVVAAVEKVPCARTKTGDYGHAVKRQHGFYAGNLRMAVLSAASSAEIGSFLRANVAAKSHLLTDGFKGYQGRAAALADHLKHTPVILDGGANAPALARAVPDHPYRLQQHEGVAGWHPSWRQRQAPAALSAGMDLSLQSPQQSRRTRWLSHPKGDGMHHHHLPAVDHRRHA